MYHIKYQNSCTEGGDIAQNIYFNQYLFYI